MLRSSRIVAHFNALTIYFKLSTGMGTLRSLYFFPLISSPRITKGSNKNHSRQPITSSPFLFYLHHSTYFAESRHSFHHQKLSVQKTRHSPYSHRNGYLGLSISNAYFPLSEPNSHECISVILYPKSRQAGSNPRLTRLASRGCLQCSCLPSDACSVKMAQGEDYRKRENKWIKCPLLRRLRKIFLAFLTREAYSYL